MFLKLQEYEYLPDNWQVTYDHIVNARNAVLEYFNSLVSNIEIAYKKGNFKVFSSIDYQNKKRRAVEFSSNNPYISPKCSVDKYGIKTNNYVVQSNDDKYSSERKVEMIESIYHVYVMNILLRYRFL